MRTGKLIFLLLIISVLTVLPAVVAAQAIWTSGAITKAPWKDTYTHIQINDVNYTLLPGGVRIARHYQQKPGMYVEAQVKLSDLEAGQAVMIRAQGHRIYEILIVE